jgi:PKD repeat protein
MLLTVIPSPVANFSFSQMGYAATFTDLSQGGVTAYNWSFGDGGTSTQQSPQYNYSNAGIYVVRLIVTNACRNDTISKILQVYGVQTDSEVHLESRFELYPNPAEQGYIMLNAKGLTGKADYIYFTMRSITGASVFSIQIPVEGRVDFEYKILPEMLLPKGVYTAEISYDGFTKVLKQIIQ